MRTEEIGLIIILFVNDYLELNIRDRVIAESNVLRFDFITVSGERSERFVVICTCSTIFPRNL